MTELLLMTIKSLFAIMFVLLVVIPLIWAERRGAAFIQDRRGPNRAEIMGIRAIGLFHPFADFIKLIFKEDIIPERVDKRYFTLAPLLVMIPPLLIAALFPFSDTIRFDGGEFIFQVAKVNPGVVLILAFSSLVVYGIILAGWSSNSKYPFLGAMRGSAQMLSYEVSLGLSIVGVIMIAASPRLQDIVAYQGGEILGFIPRWGFLLTPLGFIVFITALFAETNRVPFDLMEADSELVAGYHLEYSGLKFAMFFVGEYSSMVVGAMLTTSLFFGGWQVPFLSTEELKEVAPLILRYGGLVGGTLLLLISVILLKKFRRGRYGDRRDFEPLFFSSIFFIVSVILFAGGLSIPQTDLIRAISAGFIQFLSFTVKTLFFCWFFIWVRWTLPRFRYDQLMRLGWQVLLPLALLNIVVTGMGIIIS